ncbi:MAG TPA: hypothetical protein VFQ63_01510 [Patescibacteria group bacterium]|nr:hypothetical protein [Patescibacteria group bacterium]
MDSTLPPQNQSFFTRHKFSIISFIILILALIPLIVLSQSPKKKTTEKLSSAGFVQPTVSPTPTIMPLPPEKALPTIQATDQNIQNALNQANSEVTAASQIDMTQDSTQGL